MRRSPLARVGPALVQTGPQFSRQYYHRVLRYNPVAFWPGWEASGTNARCLVGTGMDGTWARDVATMGTAIGIGDGNTIPTYDGVQDYCDVYSTTLRDAFNNAEGSLLVWAKVSGVGVWTDSTARAMCGLYTDDNNWSRMYRTTTNNQVAFYYVAGAISDVVVLNGLSTTAFQIYGLTWSVSADEMIAYYQGAQIGTPQTGLGTWAGNLNTNGVVIGAWHTTPFAPWSGSVAQMLLFDRALPATAIKDLAKV